MITLEPKQFAAELEPAFTFMFNVGFIVGFALGCFIALLVFMRYSKPN